MKLFTIATLGLVGLLLLAAGFGGVWVVLALLYSTGFTFFMDRLIGQATKDLTTKKPVIKNPDPSAEFPAGLALSTLLGGLHFGLLVVAVWTIAGPIGFSGWERIGIFIAYGLFFGQVSHPNAHELIHRRTRTPQRLGRMIYSSLLVGRHASVHRLVHHVHVATANDPNSARLGLGFYRYAQTAWRAAFRAGLVAENKRLAAVDGYWWQHPYVEYGALAFATLTFAFSTAGLGGIFTLVGLAIYAQIQMLLSDYVQHYGLHREILADGRPEPVGPQHSWNSPHIFSSALMMNAPRHSDHHMTPNRPYPALQLDAQTMPIFPHSLPVMALIALWPPLWREIMNPLCNEWRASWLRPHRSNPQGALLPALPTTTSRAIAPTGNTAPDGLIAPQAAGETHRNLPKSPHETHKISRPPRPSVSG